MIGGFCLGIALAILTVTPCLAQTASDASVSLNLCRRLPLIIPATEMSFRSRSSGGRFSGTNCLARRGRYFSSTLARVWIRLRLRRSVSADDSVGSSTRSAHLTHISSVS